jgi:hypothetical protein
VPAAVSNANSSIDTTQLGERTAFWSPNGCDIASYFAPQELVLDITLCGDWAGQASTLASTGCAALTGTATCYSTYVLDSNNYDNAYFEIQYIKVYSASAATNASAVSKTATQASSTSKATGTTGATSGAEQLGVGLWGGVAAFVLGLMSL